MGDTVVEKRLRLMPFYLISAEIDIDTDTIIPGTVEPIRNQHLLIESRTSNGTKTYARTDELGLLCKVNPSNPDAKNPVRGFVSETPFIQLLSSELVETAILHKDPNENTTTSIWHTQIGSLIEQINSPDSEEDITLDMSQLNFAVKPFTKEDLAYSGMPAVQAQVKEQFERHFTGTHYGIVIPKKRHLVVVLPFKTVSDGQITLEELTNNSTLVTTDIEPSLLTFKVPTEYKNSLNGTGKSADSLIEESKTVVGVIVSRPAGELPDGLYKITVNWNDREFFDSATEQMSSTYTLTTRCTFEMHTLLGEMDIFNAAPLSLEEQVFLQFPAPYEQLQSALKSGAEYTASEQTPFTEAQNHLKKYVDIAQIIKSKHDYIVSSHEEKIIGFLDNVFKKITDQDTALISAYELSKGIYLAQKAARNIKTIWTVNTALFSYLNAADHLSKAQKFFRFAQAQQLLADENADILRAILDKPQYTDLGFRIFEGNDEAKKLRFLFSRNVPIDKIAATDFNPAALGGTDLVGAVDIAFSAYDTSMNLIGVWNANQDAAKAKEEYGKKINSIAELNLPSGSREATGTMIKARTMVDLKEIGASNAEVEAVLSVLNLALSIAQVIPVTAPVATAISIVKGAGEAAKLAYTTVADALEREYPGLLFSQMRARNRIVKQLNKDMKANLSLIADRKSTELFTTAQQKELYRQSRVHGEVIRAIIALVTRLSCRIYHTVDTEDGKKGIIDYNEFNEKLTLYKFDEFLQTYLYTSGWLIPEKNYLPIGLETLWLHRIRTKQSMLCNPELPHVSIADIVYDLSYFGLKPENGRIPPNHFSADFQKYFPIHYSECSSPTRFAHIFSQNYTGAPALLRWTQIYYREAPKADQTFAINDHWEPLTTFYRTKNVMGTGIQLRIVVAFEKGIDIRAVPTSIRLNRDEWDQNIFGPEYKFTCDILAKGEGGLMPEKFAEEADLERALGKVFFPFFEFADTTHYGPMPLEYDMNKAHFLMPNIIAQIWRSGVNSPNDYYYTMKIGDNETSIVDIGYETTLVDRFSNRKGEKTFLFQLDPSQNPDSAMMESETFLTSHTSSEKRPSIVPDRARTGIAGILFHTLEDQLYVPIVSRIYGRDETVETDEYTVPAKYFTPGQECSCTVILYSNTLNESEFVRSETYISHLLDSPIQIKLDGKSTEAEFSIKLLGMEYNNMDEKDQQAKSRLFLLGGASDQATASGFQEWKYWSSLEFTENGARIKRPGASASWQRMGKKHEIKVQTALPELFAWMRSGARYYHNMETSFGTFSKLYFFGSRFSLTYENEQKQEIKTLDPLFNSDHPIYITINASAEWVAKCPRKFRISTRGTQERIEDILKDTSGNTGEDPFTL